MINCCKGCTARRMRCHTECVHYLTEKALLEQRKEQREAEYAGSYGKLDSARVNTRLRRKIRGKD